MEIQKRCKNNIVESLRQSIANIGLPRNVYVRANDHDVLVNSNNKTAMKCRFYPKSELRKLLTRAVVEDVLNHDCPRYCDQQRLIEETINEEEDFFGARRVMNKSPELSKQWAEEIVPDDELSGAVTIFALLIAIRRPLLIIGFLEKGIDDEAFPKLCDLLNKGNNLIFEYWSNFHQREPEASTKAAQTFKKQMWSFIPPKITVNTRSITTRQYASERILPILERQILGKGGYSMVYKVKIHKEYFNVPHPFKAEEYALKQLTLSKDVEIKKEIETLRLVQEKPHAKIIRLLAVYEHKSFQGPNQRAYSFLMPLMDGNLREYLRGDLESSFDGQQTQIGLKAMMVGKLYKQLMGVVGALHHMVYKIKMHRIDLKPENILVKREPDSNGGYNDIFVLTDFGQARVKRTGQFVTAAEVAVTFAGAITDAYAPPEAFSSAWAGQTIPGVVDTEKWDIWPLGCIFVEIFTFLRLGHQGVVCLDGERQTKPHTNVDALDWRFWSTQQSGPKLKDSIEGWLRRLKEGDFKGLDISLEQDQEIDENLQSKCKEFMKWNVELTDKMLNPIPQFRYSINEILEFMSTELLGPDSLITSIQTQSDLDELFGTVARRKSTFLIAPGMDSLGTGLPSPYPALTPATVLGQPLSIQVPNSNMEGSSNYAGPIAGFPSQDSLSSSSSFGQDQGELPSFPDHQAQGPDFMSDMSSAPEKAESLSESFNLGLGMFSPEMPGPADPQLSLSNPMGLVPLSPGSYEHEQLQMQDIGYYIYGEAGNGTVMICLTSSQDYNIHTRSDDPGTNYKRHKLFVIREKTAMIPLHLLSTQNLDSYQQSIGSAPRYILQFDGERIVPGTGLHTSNLQSMNNLFEVLTQQKVVITLPLKSLILRHEKRGFRNLFQPLLDLQYHAYWVEIWCELDPVTIPQSTTADDTSSIGTPGGGGGGSSFKFSPPVRSDTGSTARTTSSRMSTSSNSPNHGFGTSSLRLPPGYTAFPNTRRIVVYCNSGLIDSNYGADTIFSIRFDGGILPQRRGSTNGSANSHMHRGTENLDPNTVRIFRQKAVTGTHKDKVSAYRISKAKSPGIPMSPVSLWAQETTHEIVCSSVELQFENKQDTGQFSITYLKEYQQYIEELRASER